MFNSCVTTWWTIRSLMLSSSVIIQIVKHWSWWVKALTRLTLMLVLTAKSQFIFHHFSPIYKVFVPLKYLSMW
jgi:hypothetical protein